jgi:hypothetical protein
VADLPTTLSAGVNRQDMPLTITFAYPENGAWRTIPGSQTATIRAYTLLGPPSVAFGSHTGAPYLPWVAAVDLVATWSGGSAVDAQTLASVVCDGVYDNMGLVYDTQQGAPAYAYGGLNSLQLDLTGFLSLSSGNAVNCSDCTTLAATLANMTGGDLDYAIISSNFQVNDVLGIGLSAFTGDLFGTGYRTVFSFHAFATPDLGMSVDDDTLTLNGGPNPWGPPYAPVRARGLDFGTYLGLLTPDQPTIQGTPHHPTIR